MKKRIYIAGAVSGLDRKAVERKFLHAETIINSMGHIPINPVKIIPTPPNNMTAEQEQEFWINSIAILLPELMRADSVLVLKDYKQSKGAKIEHYTAQIMEKEIIYQKQ